LPVLSKSFTFGFVCTLPFLRLGFESMIKLTFGSFLLLVRLQNLIYFLMCNLIKFALNRKKAAERFNFALPPYLLYLASYPYI